jgi:hypothetical protein
VHTWLESLRNIEKSDKAIVIVFTPNFREFNEKWKDLEALYPESEFSYIKDEEGISKLIGIYIPIIRPYCLMKYFNAHPDMVSKAIFYCDCDVVFTESFNIDEYIDDDVCYLSDTNSYINASYFDSKINDVLPEKLNDYMKADILSEVTSLVGINREVCELNNDHSGGAQYLLKNIGASFWEKMIGDCITITYYLRNVNKEFFENENKGFQVWCADMWALLWNLWFREQETRIIPAMNFAWSSDHIDKLANVGILHNAGITSNFQGDIPAFYKGNYHNDRSPFQDVHVMEVLSNEKSKTLCNHYYLQQMFNVKNKYKLNY